MEIFRDAKRKIKDKIDQKKEQLEKKKLENELIGTFERYTKDIKQDLINLNESAQLLNAVALADTFRDMCAKIGEDEDLGTPQHYQFLNIVRKWDREIERLIDDMKYRFEYGNEDKFRVKGKRPTDYATHILSSLKTIVKDYQERAKERQRLKKQRLEEKRKNIKHNNKNGEGNGSGKSKSEMTIEDYERYGETPPLILRIKRWWDYTLHPEKDPQNEEKVKQFRKELKEKEEEEIEEELKPKYEKSIVEDFLEKVDSIFKSYEEMGYYQHLKILGKKWLDFLENLSEKIRTPNEPDKYMYKTESIGPLLKIVRGYFLHMEDWMERVHRKYEDPEKINKKEPEVDKEEFQKLLQSYKKMRRKKIRDLEDRRIIKIINKKERKEKIADFFRNIKQKIKEFKVQLKEKKEEIAQERAQRKREKELRKQKEKEEERRKKEEERRKKEEERRKKEKEERKKREEEKKRKEEEKKKKETRKRKKEKKEKQKEEQGEGEKNDESKSKKERDEKNEEKKSPKKKNEPRKVDGEEAKTKQTKEEKPKETKNKENKQKETEKSKNKE